MSDDKKDWLSKPAPSLTREGVRDGHRLVRPPFKPSVRVKPHINTLLGDAYSILQMELERLREKLEGGQELSPAEAAKFTRYSDALAKLAREEREQEAKSDPAQYDMDTLLKKAREAEAILVEVIEVKKDE